jgi:hypothetical protein
MTLERSQVLEDNSLAPLSASERLTRTTMALHLAD